MPPDVATPRTEQGGCVSGGQRPYRVWDGVIRAWQPGEDSEVRSKAERLRDEEQVRLVGQTTSEWWIGQSAVGLVCAPPFV